MPITPNFVEAMNGALFIDLTIALLMFVAFIRVELSTFGYRMRAQAAISIMVLILGDAILRGWFWYWRSQVNDGLSVVWMDAWNVAPIGMAVEMLGVLCLIRVFSPDYWHRFTWLWLGLLAIAVSVAVSLL